MREKPILGRGSYGGKGDYPKLPHKAQGKESVPGWKFAAQAVESEVDEETGMVKVRRIVSAHDTGKSLNPLMVKGQIVGGVVMGLGYALHERIQFDDGQVVNPSFMDYKIPSSQEIPEIIPICVRFHSRKALLGQRESVSWPSSASPRPLATRSMTPSK